MDHTLRCNVLKCRKELSDHAVVTTCSHIFCIDCSNRCRLAAGHPGLDGQRPQCPACDMHLTNPDDVAVTNLNLTEDYKTSILSGLSPNTIMECAGRALSFWAYQTAQEIVYQEFLSKNLTDKYAALNTHLDKIIRDANEEISNLRNKVSGMAVEQESIRRKNEELAQALREKTRKHLQTQELYDKLKRRAMLGHVQEAALDAVDHTIQESVAESRLTDRVGNDSQRPPPPLFSHQQNSHMPRSNSHVHSGHHPKAPMDIPTGGWAGFNGQGSVQQSQTVQTPSTHRQRLGAGPGMTQGIGLVNLQSSRVAGTPMSSRRPSSRGILPGLGGSTGSSSGFSGYGMSAGLKASNPAGPGPGSGPGGYVQPMMGSRVTPRPSSTNLNTGFDPSRPSNMFSNANSHY